MPAGQFFPRGIQIRGAAFGVRAVAGLATSSAITSVGNVTVTAGGLVPTATVSSSGTTLVSYGVHLLTGTTATMLLANPTVGRQIDFVGTGATGTTYTIVINTTATNFMSSSGAAAARQFAANGGFGATVVGTSSGLYNVTNIFGNVVFSSTT